MVKDKILFYVSSYEDAQRVFPYVLQLSDSYEVAFDSPDVRTVELLALTHCLVVKLSSYDPDIVVSDLRNIYKGSISVSSFIEAMV